MTAISPYVIGRWSRTIRGPTDCRSRLDPAARTDAMSRPTGVATTNPAFDAASRTPGVAKRVQPEEPGRGHERQADEDEPRVPASTGGVGGHHPQGEVDQAGDEDQPEVGGVMLPASVHLGPGEQDEEAEERGGEERSDAQHARNLTERVSIWSR